VTKAKNPSANPEKNKKPYQQPRLKSYGDVRELTRAITATMGMDGGVAPAHMVMNCVTQAPYLEEHRQLLRDNTQEIFRRAILAAVKPGDVVLDLGTGSGLHAFFACEAGASRVYALEAEPIIDLAKVAAARNGLSDKIIFIEGISSEVELPEKVDVIITNIGYLGILQSLPDARRRFLKEGGRLVPETATNWFVPIESESVYKDWLGAWDEKVHGFDFSDFRTHTAHTPHYHHFQEDVYLAAPGAASVIDYSQDLPNVFHWHLEFTATRAGKIHGVLGWYEFNLGNGENFSTKPPLKFSPYIWTQYFFPLETPIEVSAGENIKVKLTMAPHALKMDPVWKWELSTDRFTMREQSNFSTAALRLN
jgi:precorrin-6B methylase 2